METQKANPFDKATCKIEAPVPDAAMISKLNGMTYAEIQEDAKLFLALQQMPGMLAAKYQQHYNRPLQLPTAKKRSK